MTDLSATDSSIWKSSTCISWSPAMSICMYYKEAVKKNDGLTMDTRGNGLETPIQLPYNNGDSAAASVL